MNDGTPTSNEALIYETTCHWAMMLGPLLVIALGLLASKSQGYHAMALTAFGLIWGFFSYTSLRASRIELTREMIRVKAGFPVATSYEIPLAKLIAIDFYQPSLGSILNFGKVTIVADQRTRRVIRFVSSPAEFVTRVRQQAVRVNPPAQGQGQ